MTVKELVKNLQKCNPDSRIKIIQEEILECEEDWWDDEAGKVSGTATELYTEDLYSHGFYLLAIEKCKE